MHVNPVVRHDIADGFVLRLVLKIQMIDENTDGHVVAVRKTCGNSCGIGRNIIHAGDKIADRHGRDHIIAVDGNFLSILLIDDTGENIVGILDNPDNLCSGEDGASCLADFFCRDIPELTRAELRIAELLNKGGLYLAVLLVKHLAEGILQNCGDGYALYSLGTPGRINLGRMASPEVLGIVLEEHGVQLLAKTIDVEILQRILLAREKSCLDIGKTDYNGGAKSHVGKGLRLQGNRIVEELAVEENAADAVSSEHDAVRRLRIRTTLHQSHIAAKLPVITGRSTLSGKHMIPPGVDLRNLGEKAVPTHVHAVSLVINRSGNSAEFLGFFKNRNFEFSLVLQKLIGSGKTRRARADDQNLFHENTP